MDAEKKAEDAYDARKLSVFNKKSGRQAGGFDKMLTFIRRERASCIETLLWQ
jgi:hypothetical protein